jgi:hypothetical protein
MKKHMTWTTSMPIIGAQTWFLARIGSKREPGGIIDEERGAFVVVDVSSIRYPLD